MKPLISVIIANRNGRQFLPNCLRTLFKDKSRKYEVIIVDDCSSDGSVDFIRKYLKKEKRLKLLAVSTHIGTGNVINRGVSISGGKYLFFLNNDTEIENDWSRHIIDFFRTYKKAAIGQAKILKINTRKFDYAGDYLGPFGFLIERAQGAVDQGQFDTVVKVFSVKGTAMFVDKEVFNKLGRFDKDYKFAIEETDFTWRAWLAGYETYYYPKFTVWHAYGTKKKGHAYYVKSNVIYQGCKNTISTLIKNYGLRSLLTIVPINAVAWLILSSGSLARGDVKKSFEILKGIGWNIFFLPLTLFKRYRIQRMRRLSDEKLFELVGASRNVTYYFRKALSYLTGKPY